MVYAEPTIRTFTQWSPAQIKTARLMADGGSLRLAADLCEEMLGDDRLQATLGTRTQGLLGLPFQIEPAGDARQKSRIVTALKEDWPLIASNEAVSAMLGWAVLLGVGLAQVVWRDTGSRIVPTLDPWHPRWLRQDRQDRQWKVTVEGGHDVPIVPGQGQWLLFTPTGEKRPWVRGAWRGCAVWWLLKQYSIQDWARYSEAHGNPIKKGMVPRGTTPEDRIAFARDLSDMARDAAIALPPDYALDLVEAKSRTWDTFQAQVRAADEGMTIAVLGQNLTTSVQGGSLAAAQVHQEVRADLLEADAEALAGTIRSQLLTLWAEFNFGDGRLAPIPVWDATPPPDRAAEAGALKTLGEAAEIWARAGSPLDSTAISERFNVPLAKQIPPTQPSPSEGGGDGKGTQAANLVQLASGDRVPRSDPFVVGQLYADAVADRGRERGAGAVQPNLQELATLIEQADSYETLRTQLQAQLPGQDPEAFAEVMERALILADLGGRLAAGVEAGVTR